MEIGLVGLPNAGKSTLFNAITKASVPAEAYAFTTIEPNVGVVNVPDSRLDELAQLINPERIVPAVVRFVDIAGLVKGASKGEGLGNKFLGNIRQVDAIAQVVRCFEAEVAHVSNKVDPADDIETINTELALADLATCEKRAEKLDKLKNSQDKEAAMLRVQIDELIKMLSNGELAINFEHIDNFKDLSLLTSKPVIFVANISEEKLRDGDLSEANPVIEYAEKNKCDYTTISAKVESELTELSDEDAQIFREELNMEESGLDKLVRTSYHTLGLMSYFTAGVKEVRAWTITQGATAPEAAGVIHTDFQRGFIKAEVINYKQLIEDGSTNNAKDKGHLRLEGKDYIAQDGDVMNFKFNV